MFWLILLLACAVAGTSCTLLCRAVVRAAVAEGTPLPRGHRLTVYEAAFLSGGPHRVAEVAMVSMARQHRLVLAHTGWATVVDPRGRDALERTVLGAIGSTGQARIARVRAAVAGDEAVRALGDRLTTAGLAVPEHTRGTVTNAVQLVRVSSLVVLGLGASAWVAAPPAPGGAATTHAAWFALPLLLTASCLLIARVEAQPYTRWASASGRALLCGLSARPGGDDRTYLTAVAVGGVPAADDPGLVAAFAHRDHHGGTDRVLRPGPTDRGSARRER
jgi:uncharacterized protein (TIGR04222 family)